MKLELKFKNIIDVPKCKILLDNKELYSGVVLPSFTYEHSCIDGQCQLLIEHWDKIPSDTIVQDGKIVRDRSFELDKIIVDDYDIEELIWASEFLAQDGQRYPSCLFFGPNGKFKLDFYNPVLYWILKTRHEKNNNDPNWEEDYNYYQQACKILTQI
jgi:hypothetical protein